MRSAAVVHLGSSGARSAASYHRGPFGRKSRHPTADPPHRPGPGTAPIPLTSLHFQNEGILEAFTYKGKPFDPSRIGRDLNVRYVVTGSLIADAERVRVNAQLVEAETNVEV